MNLRKKWLLTLSVAIIILGILPFVGGESLWAMVFGHSDSAVDRRILFEMRIPRLGIVLVTGGTLAILGACYQILFSNPLAEPYVLGISSAVTLGAVISEVFLKILPDSIYSPVLGLTAALIITLLLLISQQSRWGSNLERIVLFGIGVNFVLSSVLFLILSYHAQTLGGGSLKWLFGGIPWVTGTESLQYLMYLLPFIIALFILGRSLDALSLGDSVSMSLGFSPRSIRGLCLFLSSVCLAIISTKTGAIGFVGLVIPHCVRLVYRPPSTRQLFLLSFLIGAIFLGLSDGLSRAILPPFEFPVGVITTVIGGPIFLVLLWKR